MRKKWWIVALVVVIVAGLGYGAFSLWRRISSARDVLEATAEETAIVRRGTLRLTVDASGSLAPQDEVTLSFLSGGQVLQVLVEDGNVVQAGDVLIRLDDTEARQAVAEAELQVRNAEINLALARIEAETGLAQANLDAARASYDEAAALAGRVGDQLASARIGLQRAQENLADAQENYDEAWDPARDWELQVAWRKAALEAQREATETALREAQLSLEEAQASYDLAVVGISGKEVENARAQMLGAEATLEQEPLQLQQLELALSQARLALESAQRTLEDMALVAPVAGTVTGVNVGVGEMASAGQPAVALSDLATLVVDVNLDETEVADVSVGQEAIVTLDAFPDAELSGQVATIAPVAQVQSGVVLYPLTVELAAADLPVRAGMTADVEIVIAGKENVLVVPLRAVRSMDGQSFVLRRVSDERGGAASGTPLSPTGTGRRGGAPSWMIAGFEPVSVTLGLTTDTEVEITGGLAEGDVVSVVALPDQDSGPFAGGPMPGPFVRLRGGD